MHIMMSFCALFIPGFTKYWAGYCLLLGLVFSSHCVVVGQNEGRTWTEMVKGTWDWGLSSACSLTRRECCRKPFIRIDEAISNLTERLKKELFGQPLAQTIVLNSLDAHFNDPEPNKALVLSFHGWAGSGKTFLVEHIMKAMYKKGVDSVYVKFYMASYHFPDESKVNQYKELVKGDIEKQVESCEYSLFVFDEVDKTPPGVFDAVVPFIDHPGLIKGVNHKKSIFIFLSNSGSNDITALTLKYWKEGRRREDLTFKDFEDLLSKEAFNKKGGGLYRSRVIDKVLVDFFIPFLPMERKHIIECALMEGRRHGEDIDAEDIADSLTYWPPDLKLYSQTGCKRVESLVKYQLAERRLRKDFDDNEQRTEL